jgi:hypothetical protein
MAFFWIMIGVFLLFLGMALFCLFLRNKSDHDVWMP